MAHSTTPSLGVQDFFTTTLSGNVALSDTVINLTNVPSPTEGYLVIDPNNPTTREIIYYTSKTSSTVTCPDATQGSARGVGGTTAQTHLSGVAVEMRYTAEHFTALQNGQSLAAGVALANLVAKSVTNSYLANGLVANRQGGTSGDNDWNTSGTSNTDTSAKAVFIQVGTQASNSGSAVTVTFPVAFTKAPVVFMTGISGGSVVIAQLASFATTTGFTFVANSAAAGGTQITANCSWVAIGQ